LATEVVIPMLGVTVETGTIVEWLKQEGDEVQKGESIYAVEADKVSTEVESPATGILAKILLAENETVPVLTVVGVITEPGEEVPEMYLQGRILGGLEEADVKPDVAPAVVEKATPVAVAASQGPIRAMPAARKLATDQGLDLAFVQGTGPDGVIQLKDVENSVQQQGASGAKASSLARGLADKKGLSLDGVSGSGVRGRVMRSDVAQALEDASRPQLGKTMPMDNMRQVISRRMCESKFSAPHIYFFSDINMDPLLAYRWQIVPEFENTFGLRPSINDFLIKAVALTILENPLLNATLQDNQVVIQPEINVCLAVALPDGLITPAIANADRAGLADVVRQRSDLVRRAKAGQLELAELQRGTFTISSLASFDVDQFTAIINPPQSGILSVGQTRDSLYLDNGDVKSRKVATFGLSVDHRIIDGVVAAGFLQDLKKKLQNPGFTFLHI
jgi:pyruvate dehydrogenase E2 component (dihydrolipoamide acetyltransferase)